MLSKLIVRQELDDFVNCDLEMFNNIELITILKKTNFVVIFSMIKLKFITLIHQLYHSHVIVKL